MKAIYILLIAILLLASCGTQTGDEKVKIGFLGPLTGDVAFVGESALASARLAVKEVNDAGGINGKNIELIAEDGKCRGQESSIAANKLVNIDKVIAIIGGICSAETIAAAPVAEKAGVVMISPGSSSPDITDAGDYIFRNYPSDAYQGKAAAEYFHDNGYHKVAILYEISDYPQGIYDVFSQAFPKLPGVEITRVESVAPGTLDLRTTLTRLRKDEPDALYVLTYTDIAVAVMQQTKELGWDPFIFGADGWVDPVIPELAGSAADGARYLLVTTEVPEDFKQRVVELTGHEPVIGGPQSYDTVHMITKLMNEGATTSEELKEALYALDVYEGVSYPTSFDENGDLERVEYGLAEFQDGVSITIE